MAEKNHASYFVHTLLRAHDWQERIEFSHVCDWWRRGGKGVCALIGMGGAGKTAIAERFLRVIPNALPEDPAVGKETALPEASSTFVFSFYDAPNEDAFFEAIQIWLLGDALNRSQLSVSRLLFLLQNASGLMVLDGLETVQNNGTHGNFGRINSLELREVLDRLAGGYMRHLSVLITSRFPLADLRNAHSHFFQRIFVDQIDIVTGVQLLRQRGVAGTNLQLSLLVEQCGRHALTIDLTGGFISEFCNGDANISIDLGASEELEEKTAWECDEEKRAVLIQGHRFRRVAERYREALLESDESAISLLERICLFRLGVDFDTLVNIFTGPRAIPISGSALANLSQVQLRRKLDWLIRLRLVEEVEGDFGLRRNQCSKEPTKFTVHPAVRDGFISGITRSVATASHKAIWEDLVVSLGNSPTAMPTDSAVLDILEEIIHHALETGNTKAAWEIYSSRIGGCQNLLAGLNDYIRARRITNAIKTRHVQGMKLSSELEIILYSDFGYSSLALGHLETAILSLEHGFVLAKRTKSGNTKTLARNLSCAYFNSGNLRLAINIAKDILELSRDRESYFQMLVWIAEIRADQGQVQSTIKISDLPSHLQGPLSLELPVTVCSEYLDRGRYASQQCEHICQLEKKYTDGHHNLASAQLEYAHSATSSLDFSSAYDAASKAYDWAVAHDEKLVMVRSLLIQARINFAAISSEYERIKDTGDVITEGLKIARDCGFGLLHIDLLLEQARFYISKNNPQGAIEDLRLAMDSGINHDDRTGQPYLIAACHPDCDYAWAIAKGLHLRGIARLVIAFQIHGQDSFAVSGVEELPQNVREQIELAKNDFDEAISSWQNLRNPNSKIGDNYVFNDIEYHFLAEKTFKAKVALESGLLATAISSDCRLSDIGAETLAEVVPKPSRSPTSSCEIIEPQKKDMEMKRFDIALSFPGEHRPFVKGIADSLADTLTKERVFYDFYHEAELARPNLDVYLQKIYHDETRLIVVFLCKDYNDKEWCYLEARAIRDLIKKRKDDEIMFIKVGEGEVDGVFSVDGYVSANERSAVDIAKVILKRLSQLVRS